MLRRRLILTAACRLCGSTRIKKDAVALECAVQLGLNPQRVSIVATDSTFAVGRGRLLREDEVACLPSADEGCHVETARLALLPCIRKVA